MLSRTTKIRSHPYVFIGVHLLLSCIPFLVHPGTTTTLVADAASFISSQVVTKRSFTSPKSQLCLTMMEEKKDDNIYQSNYFLTSYGETKESGISLESWAVRKPKMIVFDKDGTLGDCTASLRRWADHMTTRLTESLLTTPPLALAASVKTFHDTIGWDVSIQNVVPSAPLAAGTWAEQVQTASHILGRLGVDPRKAQEWHDELGNLHGADPPVISNLRSMLLDCRDMGLIVAVCTSDDRAPTDASLRNWGITDVVQYSICGNEVTQSKPSAEPLRQLCRLANVNPEDCIVVGDTTSDTGMARNAGAALCLGVLTGSGTPDQLLQTGADIILPDVGHIPHLLQVMGICSKVPPITLLEREEPLSVSMPLDMPRIGMEAFEMIYAMEE